MNTMEDTELTRDVSELMHAVYTAVHHGIVQVSDLAIHCSYIVVDGC